MKNQTLFFYIFTLTGLLIACSAGKKPVPSASLGSDQPVQTLTFPENTLHVEYTSIVEPTLTPKSTSQNISSITDFSAEIQSSYTPEFQIRKFPDPADYSWQLIVGGLASPVGLEHAGDGSGNLFIVEQDGLIRILDGTMLLATPFLDIRDRIGRNGSEQGLLGLAFHPNYFVNGYFYVNYTDFDGNTVIARFQRSDMDPNFADPESEKKLFSITQPFSNHNGGALAFGPDGYLYLGLGDGGSAGDPQGNGQSLNSLLGKVLRIDIDQSEPYSIPPDNPFNDGSAKPEIWAYGLRNPWRFSFDRITGDLFIGDVGQNEWEEINFLPFGANGDLNFGWNFFEGTHPYSGLSPEKKRLVMPVSEYHHDLGCSVTGGIVYRGAKLPDFYGTYLYGDYCSGRVWGLLRDEQRNWISTILFEGVANISSFGEDESGEIYLVNHQGSLLLLVGN